MHSKLRSWITGADALLTVASLVFALWLPIGFMLPYNDEWLRMNYLADHSVWQWTVMHTETWVVRPTAELIMALLSAQTTRTELGAHAGADLFLERFHAGYAALALGLLALLVVLAALLGQRRERTLAFSGLCGCVWLCIWASDELGYAFYWADGYANVVLPFCWLLIGLTLACRPTPLAQGAGALCLLIAALGHEVLCIYASGFVLLQLLRVREHTRRARLLYALLLCGLLAVLYAQGFSTGPSQRSQAYVAKTGVAYNWSGAFSALRTIDALRSASACVATWAWLAALRPRLAGTLTRAVRHAQAHPLYWTALSAGALITSLIPLASVGLKKASVIVGAYSVATQLFIVLGAALSYPLVAEGLEPIFRPYRKWIGSALPVLVVAAWLSPNLPSYRAAYRERAGLREQAHPYMQQLYDGNGKRVRTVRPCHPFIKPASGMTMRNAKQYFELGRFKELDCKRSG